VPPAAAGDTKTIEETLTTAAENVEQAHPESDGIQELVADKGYHSNQVLQDLTELEIRTYISEPDRGRRIWKGKAAARQAVYRNRRRIRGVRGRRLLRQRGERLERPFAHAYETGRMRRVYLRGRSNILKRILIHTAALNLGLLMRALVGVGTPRSLQGRLQALAASLFALWRCFTSMHAVPASASASNACD
jgi:DDE family transposase